MNDIDPGLVRAALATLLADEPALPSSVAGIEWRARQRAAWRLGAVSAVVALVVTAASVAAVSLFRGPAGTSIPPSTSTTTVPDDAVFLSGVAAVRTTPPAPADQLSGIVIELLTGEPIAAATVRITDVSGRVWEVAAGTDGTFRVTGPVGDLQFTVSADGYAEFVKRYTYDQWHQSMVRIPMLKTN